MVCMLPLSTMLINKTTGYIIDNVKINNPLFIVGLNKKYAIMEPWNKRPIAHKKAVLRDCKRRHTNLQSVTKYWRLKFSCEIAHHGKGLIAIFRDFFASTNKILILAGGWALDYHCMKFDTFLIFPNFLRS